MKDEEKFECRVKKGLGTYRYRFEGDIDPTVFKPGKKVALTQKQFELVEACVEKVPHKRVIGKRRAR